jgi:hypothetical protein
VRDKQAGTQIAGVKVENRENGGPCLSDGGEGKLVGVVVFANKYWLQRCI